MKIRISILLFALLFISCKTDKTEQSPIDYADEALDITTSTYPESISKVFDAHGGLDNWKKTKTLVFGMENPEGIEMTYTDLPTRKSLIETDKFKIGYNGKDVWLQQDEEAYKGNPKFYYNLMFYFYAMPYVLADDGIIYQDAAPLEFDGKSYPGIKIGYESGVGESPEDEYIIYYNPETYQMEWLGYTVTYFSKEKSKDFHFIKYDQWETLGGLKLPKVLQWYSNDGMAVKDVKNSREFINTEASIESMSDDTFAMPEGAKVVE